MKTENTILINRSMNKQVMVYAYNGILSNKKEYAITSVSSIDGSQNNHAEIS